MGSHANITKLGGVYVKIPCVPPYFQSKLNNIFLGMLFYTEDRKSFGNSRIFKPFIKEIQKLFDSGIEVKNKDYNIIKFVPCLILGDNLGLNSILGFSESFNANFYCRFCSLSKLECSTQCVVDFSKNFNTSSYDALKESNGISIKEYSVWNELHLYHVTENYSVDPMHDILEGVCRYDMLFLLNIFINKMKLFTIEQLNFRISTFNYGPYNQTKPPLLRSDLFQQKTIKMSAVEMFYFVKHFSLIIGNLIPIECMEWQLYIVLRKIINYCFSNIIDKNTWQELRSAVIEHNDLYMQLTELPLTPKFHMLLHYPYIMHKIGPIKHLSSLRFENFHQIFKKCAYTTKCKKNVIETLSKKYYINTVNTILNFENIINLPTSHSKEKCIDDEIKDKYNFRCSETVSSVDFVYFNNYLLKKHSVIMYESNFELIDFILLFLNLK